MCARVAQKHVVTQSTQKGLCVCGELLHANFAQGHSPVIVVVVCVQMCVTPLVGEGPAAEHCELLYAYLYQLYCKSVSVCVRTKVL